MPRWRQWLSNLCNTARHLGATLNWRRDPDYERRKRQDEQRMKELEIEILRLENVNQQIENETEQLKRENARQRALSALIRQQCFPPESSSTPAPPIGSDCGPS